jgi:methionyl aminopeptidase
LHEAGKLAAAVRDTAAKMTKPGASVIDICMAADDMIREAGAYPAFPINVSINNAAAHYTGQPGDKLLIPDRGVVKIDAGVHIDGYIADTAESVDLDGSFGDLVQSTIDATDTAIKIIRPGTSTGALGGVIQGVIEKAGFQPIRELSGHQVDRYVVHAGKTIPCVGDFKGDTVELGETYAIETFASTGPGHIHADFNTITIFRAAPIRTRARSKAARKVLSAAIHDFGGMPFAERWLTQTGLSRLEAARGLRELQNSGGIIEYHVLNAHTPDDIVSQHEHTMIIKEDGAEVTTYL